MGMFEINVGPYLPTYLHGAQSYLRSWKSLI